MSYKVLSKVYYQDKEEYEKILSERLTSENTTFLNIKIHENEAFYCLNQEIYDLTFKIMEADKKVQVIKENLPGVALEHFANKSLVDEIFLTNDIEGVRSTRKEIKIIINESEEPQKKKKNRRFYGLVTKYMMLSGARIGLRTCEDVRKIYDELVLPEITADDPDKVPDGKIYRKDLSEVTTTTQKVIHRGVYPEEKIIDYMERALKILNDDNINILIRISIFHYLFGYIHPFYDGNGRTSRFISSYLLSTYLDDLIGYRLSYTIKENLNDYNEAFSICNNNKNKGDITPFIIKFLKIISIAFEKLYEALYDRKVFLEEMLNKIKTVECFCNEEMYSLCGYLVQAKLFSADGIAKRDLCELLKISETTLRKRLKVIEEEGFLTEKRVGTHKYFAFDVEKLNY